MKAALLTNLNSPLEVEDIGLCGLDFGQVLVKVIVSGVCGAQLQEIRGEKGGPLPHLLGHEGCGIVEECGPGVSHVKKGDKVVMHWRKGLGIESDFPRYILNGKTITSGRVVTFAEMAVCSENRLTKVATDTPPEMCALLGCSLSTALATVENESRLRFGESVLIIGCGGLGGSLILASSLMHAGTICAVDVHESKRELAMSLGAHVFVNAAQTPLADIKTGFDVIIDTAGTGASMEDSLSLLNPNGRYIMVGQPPPGMNVTITNARHLFEGEGKIIRATQGGGFIPTLHIPRYVKLWQSGKLDLTKLITHRLPLSAINEAIDLVSIGLAGRILIEP